MLRTGARAAAALGAQHERHGHVVPEILVDRGLVDEGIENQRHEVRIHDLENRTGAGHRSGHRHRGERLFGDRRVADAVFAELVHQALRNLKHASVPADVLTKKEDRLVARHFLAKRLVKGFGISQFGHLRRPRNRERFSRIRRRSGAGR